MDKRPTLATLSMALTECTTIIRELLTIQSCVLDGQYYRKKILQARLKDLGELIEQLP